MHLTHTHIHTHQQHHIIISDSSGLWQKIKTTVFMFLVDTIITGKEYLQLEKQCLSLGPFGGECKSENSPPCSLELTLVSSPGDNQFWVKLIFTQFGGWGGILL